MVAVFVHGAPLTHVVWAPVIDLLRDVRVETVRLPGFGVHLPRGFEPTVDRYAEWLSSVSSAFDSVDLVGQDWGGLLVLRVVAGRPGNVRSWTVDSPDLDDGFVWHAGAQSWQDPQRAAQLRQWFTVAEVSERVAMLQRFGVGESQAVKIAPDLDATMATAMTVLYQSARDIGSEWGPGIRRIDAPGPAWSPGLTSSDHQSRFLRSRRARVLKDLSSPQQDTSGCWTTPMPWHWVSGRSGHR